MIEGMCLKTKSTDFLTFGQLKAVDKRAAEMGRSSVVNAVLVIQ